MAVQQCHRPAFVTWEIQINKPDQSSEPKTLSYIGSDRNCLAGDWRRFFIFFFPLEVKGGGCSSADRAGRLVIKRSLVQIPAPGRAELYVEQDTEPHIAHQ